MTLRQDNQLEQMDAYAVDKSSNALLLKFDGISQNAKVVKSKLIGIEPTSRALLIKFIEKISLDEFILTDDCIKTEYIDWGLEEHQVKAADIPVADEGGYFISTNIEDVLQEINQIHDADGDTYVRTEETADEDIIRFGTKGVERATIDGDTLSIAEYFRHLGDIDTYFRFTDDRVRLLVGSIDILDITKAATDTVVWNEGGADVDFRWEGVGEPNALFIQGSDGFVGIGIATPLHRLVVNGRLTVGNQIGHTGELFFVQRGGVIDTFGAISGYNRAGLRIRSTRGNVHGLVSFDWQGKNYGSGMTTLGMIYQSGRPGYAHHYFMEDDGTIQLSILDGGNIGIRTSVFGANAAGVLGFGNTPTEPTTSVNLMHIYCRDRSADNAQFCCYQEAAIVADVDETKFSNKWPVRLNGVDYFIMLTTT